MLRFLRGLLCFSSPHTSTNDDPISEATHSANAIETSCLQCPSSRSQLPVLVRALSTSPLDSSTGTISSGTSTTAGSSADTKATECSTATESPSSSSEVLAKFPWPSLDTSTYTPLLQEDGTLQAPPHLSFGGYGSFGGRFAPESIMSFLYELDSFFEKSILDPSFWAEYASFQQTRATPLQVASKLTDLAGGATIWLKREDQNEYGSHKTRNIVGQLLLARRMGFIEIVTDCASAKHGSFTAAMCARLGLRCVVIMGSDDGRVQQEDILEMKLLGAKVLTACATSGLGTLRAAITEALRYSVCNHETAFYLMGSPVGPAPLPTLARTFQGLLGEEVAAQMQDAAGCQPDAVVTAVGGGSGAIGLFRPFLRNPAIRLVGVEAAKAAALTEGEVGVLQGSRTYLLQNSHGQIIDSHSISPDLNLSSVGPELAHWKNCGRIEISTATDADALAGLKTIQHHEGFLPGLDSSHAVSRTIDLARELGPGKNLVLLVTGSDNIDLSGLGVV
ncbi:uncharacterized protein PFLUO_LOCUS8593 [Penicillium psychrofluorescens]|uniref:uncharacterized protein n=1 Tax=Penicillium psychrofluorescens TaxID=3158075 RepID=UPI003CCE1931